jgi:multidrug efflux pump subunit AcrB
MKSVIKWAISNSPAMNTFLIAALFVGTVSMVVMRREVFPAFALEILLVTVPFPGATPAEVEDGICQKLESAVANVDGVKKMTSIAAEGVGSVVLELSSNVTDVQRVLNDVRSQIDQVRAFLPPRAEDPDVRQIVFRLPAISVGIIGPELPAGTPRDGPEALEADRQLRDLAEQVRSELLDLRAVKPKNLVRGIFAPLFQPKGPAITSAEIAAERPYEISIEVEEDTLRQYGMSLQSFAQKVRQQNIDVPGGKMQTASQEMLLRGNNKREIGTEIEKLPIVTKSDGDVVTVGDMGTVIDGFEETTSINLINGRPGLVVGIAKTEKEDLFTVVETVKDYVAARKMPAGYKIDYWGDKSEDVKSRIDLLSRNGLQGLLLVFVVLAVFLELRLAFWVAMGIPISILAASFILLACGSTLNMLSMFAFLMALGIVVDDAIVIGENIYGKRELGMNHVQAAVAGTVEVLPSVTASVATTIIAFLPLMFVTGVMGKFFAIIPVAVIAMLVISLVESTFILPAHLAHENNLFLRSISGALYIFKPLLGILQWVNKRASAGMTWLIERFYDPLLRFSLNNRAIVLSTVFAFGSCCAGLVAAGFAPPGFFPKIDGRELTAVVAFPNGTAADFSKSAIADLREAIVEIDEEYQAAGNPSAIQNLYEKVGESGNQQVNPNGVQRGSHVGTVEVLLTSSEERSITTRDLIRKWRERVPKIAGTEALRFGANSMGPGGSSVEFKILASDASVDFLEAAAEECKAYLSTKVGVFDIEDDSRLGKWERSLRLNAEGQALGLDEATLAETIRAIYFGDEVQRLQRGRHEVKLMVRYPREDRENEKGFEEIRIRDNTGVERPLIEVADISHSRQVAEINRLNQRRSITVTADVDGEKGNAQQIVAEMRANFVPGLLEKFRDQYGADLTIDWDGEQAQNVESVTSMFIGFFIALICMFVLLTLQFKSYVQPLIIMSIIPFGWLGAIVGHAFMGLELTLISFFGCIALTGVVVNDSIVLVDFINARVRNGIPLKKSLLMAGRRRFRPIMLTSMTTIAGLFPMLLERSTQAQVLIPMAVALIFGLLFGTLLILILVPVFYSIYGSVLRRFGMPLYQPDMDEDESDWSSEDRNSDKVQREPAFAAVVPDTA